jgi:transcriptional regulator with XRE-family HTH domain
MQIRRLREERGYSLEELAERSGLSFRGLIYIEHGRRNPGVLTVLGIASGLNVAPARLFEDVSQAADKTDAGQRSDSGPAGPPMSDVDDG